MIGGEGMNSNMNRLEEWYNEIKELVNSNNINGMTSNPNMNCCNHSIHFNYQGHFWSKKVIIYYGGANVAKALHVGHLRSANIGEALKRLAVSLGNKAIADAHLGDWGRPIGLVMLEIKKRNPELPYFGESFEGEYPTESPVTNDDLMELYPFASTKAKEDEE